MSPRTAYWREYNRKNPDKVRAKKAAYRARNKAKIASYARTYRAEHADEPSKPSAPRIAKPRAEQAKAEAFVSLRERFAAFRAAKQAVA